MNKQFLSKTLSIVLATILGISSGLSVAHITKATVGSINITGISNVSDNNFTVSGTWEPQGNQCFSPGQGFKYWIIVYDDKNSNQTYDTGENILDVNPAPCGGYYNSEPTNKGVGGNWPATGQNSTFSLLPGSHNICTVLMHVKDQGGDIAASNCWSQTITVPFCTLNATSTCTTDAQCNGIKTCNSEGTAWLGCVDIPDDNCPTTTTTVPPTGGGGGPTGSYVPVVAGAATEQGQVAGASTACNPYLLKYIKLGADNDPEEVKKLESFLNEYLGVDLPINGIYEEADYNAVKQFQLLMKDDVLAPWVLVGCLPSDITPTGYVYRTTKWTINNFFCPEPRPDVSDETCTGGIIIGLGEEGAVLGEATTTPTTTTETTPLETTGPNVAPETEAKPSQNWLWYLIGLIVVGGGIYLVLRKKK